MSHAVEVLPYDAQWAQQFERLRARVLSAGREGGLDFHIEHVGSTAVPGLAAKPIIDVDVLVAETAQLDAARAVLTRMGYEAEGNLGIVGREAFRAPVGDPAHHLYLLGASHPQAVAHLAFRDYLRTHPETAAAYGQLKQRLAARFGCDRRGYTEAKTAFVESTLRHAVTAAPLPAHSGNPTTRRP